MFIDEITVKDKEQNASLHIEQTSFERTITVQHGPSKLNVLLSSSCAIVFTVFMASMIGSLLHNHKANTIDKTATVCRNINYAPGKETHSLVTNIPTPTLTGACGSAYLSSVNSSSLTFGHHIAGEDTPVVTKNDAEKIIGFRKKMNIGTVSQFGNSNVYENSGISDVNTVKTGDLIVALHTEKKNPDILQYPEKNLDVSSESIANMNHILSNRLGRYNAWKTMSLKIPNTSYWYSIDKDAKIHKMIIDQEVRPVISANIIKKKGDQTVANIIWLENSNNSIIPDILIHESLIIMPNSDFNQIQKHIFNVNSTTRIQSGDDDDEAGVWNRMTDEEIKDLVNKAFQ